MYMYIEYTYNISKRGGRQVTSHICVIYMYVYVYRIYIYYMETGGSTGDQSYMCYIYVYIRILFGTYNTCMYMCI